MNKIVSFEGIGYVAATFPVDAATQDYLKKNHLATTGNVDINGKKLAVKLGADVPYCIKLGTDGKVGFGTGTAADKLLGIIVAYEMDGFASVQIAGGVDEVPTSAAVTAGRQALVVNAKGEIVVVEGGREVTVAIPSTTNNKFASIIL